MVGARRRFQCPECARIIASQENSGAGGEGRVGGGESWVRSRAFFSHICEALFKFKKLTARAAP